MADSENPASWQTLPAYVTEKLVKAVDELLTGDSGCVERLVLAMCHIRKIGMGETSLPSGIGNPLGILAKRFTGGADTDIGNVTEDIIRQLSLHDVQDRARDILSWFIHYGDRDKLNARL